MKKIWVLLSLIMILVTLYQINTTYAKYYTEATGKVEETIGAWVVKLNDTNIATGTSQEQFVIEKLNIYENDNVLDGKIAPGSIGYFDIEIDATDSSVAVKYSITVDASEFEVNNSMKIYKVAALIDGVENEENIIKTGENIYTGVVSLDDIKTGKINTARIYLQWEDDGLGTNDDRDTALGTVKDTSFSVPIVVEASQYLGENIIEFNT